MDIGSASNVTRMVFGFFLPLMFIPLINIIVGIIAVNMANSRGLRTVPAFFAGFFGSFISLFFIAMIPKKTNY